MRRARDCERGEEHDGCGKAVLVEEYAGPDEDEDAGESLGLVGRVLEHFILLRWLLLVWDRGLWDLGVEARADGCRGGHYGSGEEVQRNEIVLESFCEVVMLLWEDLLEVSENEWSKAKARPDKDM